MKRIRTLQGIEDAALSRRSLKIRCWGFWRRPIPAAFVLSMQARFVCQFLKAGTYLYEPKKKTSK